MEETIDTPLPAPPRATEMNPPSVEQNFQAVVGLDPSISAATTKGKSSFLTDAVHPSGLSLTRRNTPSRSRSRGRPKYRNRSRHDPSIAGPSERSSSRTIPASNSIGAGLNLNPPQGHPNRAPSKRPGDQNRPKASLTGLGLSTGSRHPAGLDHQVSPDLQAPSSSGGIMGQKHSLLFSTSSSGTCFEPSCQPPAVTRTPNPLSPRQAETSKMKIGSSIPTPPLKALRVPLVALMIVTPMTFLGGARCFLPSKHPVPP
ncbi:hypothetical protein NL676_030264 [Syzygium grande]|nr:hypothetical protein NL676_030264 [Syzygium grande]